MTREFRVEQKALSVKGRTFMIGYEVTKDSSGQIVIRITPELARDVVEAIDQGMDMRAQHAQAVDALSDAIHELVG